MCYIKLTITSLIAKVRVIFNENFRNNFGPVIFNAYLWPEKTGLVFDNYLSKVKNDTATVITVGSSFLLLNFFVHMIYLV